MLIRLFFATTLLLATATGLARADPMMASCGQCNLPAVRSAGHLPIKVKTFPFYTIQHEKQPLSVRFYCASGEMLESTEARKAVHQKDADPFDVFNIGVSYLTDAVACDGHALFINANHDCSDLDTETLAQILKAGGVKKENPVCLLTDTKTCEEAGYPSSF